MPSTDPEAQSSPSTPVRRRVYASWDEENKENIDPFKGGNKGGAPSKRAPRTILKLRKSKLADTAVNVATDAGANAEAGSPRSVFDFKAAPATRGAKKTVVRSFDIYDEELDRASSAAIASR